MSGFRIRGTNRVAVHGFLAIDEVELEVPGGETVVRTVVRHPGAVVIVPVIDDARTALLVRQYRVVIGGELLEVPAGKRDVAGESPEETAERELAEEVGMRAGRLVELARFWNSPGFCDEYSHVFLALDLEPTDVGEAVTAEEAAITIERVGLGDVEDLVARGRLVDAKSIIGLLLARAHLAEGASGR